MRDFFIAITYVDYSVDVCISFDWLYNKDIFQKSNHTGIRKQHYWGHTRGKMALAYVRCSDTHYLNNILVIYVIVILQ